jgi:hypothetical protein
MNDELMIISNLDQDLPVDSNELEKKIEAVILQAIEEKDVYKALNVCRTMVEIQKLSGIGLAKAIYLIKTNWEKFESDEKFEDIAFEYFGKDRHTIDRYLAVQTMFVENSIPEEFESNIRQLNIMTQIPIAKALEQGYEIEEDEWRKITEAPDFSTVAKILREDVKGKPPHKGSLQLFLDDFGELYAFFNDNRYHIGMLAVDDNSDAVQKAINRIVDRAGVMRS